MNTTIIRVVTLGALVSACAVDDRAAIAPRAEPTPAAAATTALAPAATFGGYNQTTAKGFSGVGWSSTPTTEEAIAQALAKAEAGSTQPSMVTFVAYTNQHDPSRVLAALRSGDKNRHVVGMTSHDGVLTSEGYHSAPTGVLGVLSLRAEGMTIGFGGAGFDEVDASKPGEAARLAYRRAVAQAKMPSGQMPSMVVVLPTLQSEEQALAAITEEVGPDVPVLGGTPAGPSKASDPDRVKQGVEWSARSTSGAPTDAQWTGSIIIDDQVILKGAGVAVFYTPKPFGWAFDGGFERSTTKQGVITAADPRVIREIDGRPAMDVYDEWVGGGLKQAMARGDNMLQYCALHPLIRNHKDENGEARSQFLHAFPNADQANEPGSMVVGANVVLGETLSLGEGSWNILLNRFAQLPRQAKNETKELDPLAGLFIYCAGALDTIPREHRQNMSHLVAQSLGKELPWLGMFSWGEQGHVAGVGNLHGNEMASTLLFPAR